MAKRFYQSKKDRSDESRAMRRDELSDSRSYGPYPYDGFDSFDNAGYSAQNFDRYDRSDSINNAEYRAQGELNRLSRDRYDSSRDGYTVEDPRDRTRTVPSKFKDENRNDQTGERAVYRRFKALGEEFYAGSEPRRRQEIQDAGMIVEDNSAIANLPQMMMIKKYPKTGPYLPEGLEDTIEGIDHQMNYDDSQRRAHFYPKKV